MLFALFVIVCLVHAVLLVSGSATAGLVRHGVRGATARGAADGVGALPAQQGEPEDARLQGKFNSLTDLCGMLGGCCVVL